MSGMQTCGQTVRAPAPFRPSGKATPRRQRMIVTKASKEPVNDMAQKAVAAFAAAALTLTPFAASATEGGIMPSRNRAEDNAARAFLDSKESKSPQVYDKTPEDKNSGNVDTDTVAGVQQADKRTPAGRMPKSDSNTEISFSEAAADLESQPTKKGPNASKAAENKLDPTAALKKAFDRSGPTNPAPAAWTGAASSLQVNVAAPDLNALINKAQSAGDKVAGAAKDAAGNPGGKLDKAVGGAKSAAGDAKQGVKDLKKQPNVAFWGDASSLQKNVVFGRGEAGTPRDQAEGAAQELKETAANPVQSAKNAANRTGQVAERVLSNPAGGPEKSKDAAQKLSDANSEIPRALAGGAQQAKDAVTSPASFSGFNESALQRNAGLEV
jgi:hypothetical protein